MGSLAIRDTKKGTVWEPCMQPMDSATCMRMLQLFYHQRMRGESRLSMTPYHDTACSMQGMCSSLFGGSERSMQKEKEKKIDQS